ncbi:MAG: nitroreductase family deazaflavin-dependent oxidoreductase [Chloroflexi bacterium]|nr:nitroreductase family deazaflavin-dependent oxidoreductase [Chloroflexota bacterium]
MNDEVIQREKPGRFLRFMQWTMPKGMRSYVWLYRRLNGRFVNRATGGAPVLLVTTRGRRTGKLRTVPLGHIRDGDDVIVAGTNGGLPALPGWVHNLRAHPEAEVQVGSERYPVRAEFLEGEEWTRHWEQLVTAYPVYDIARRYAGREIPLILLRRIQSR